MRPCVPNNATKFFLVGTIAKASGRCDRATVIVPQHAAILVAGLLRPARPDAFGQLWRAVILAAAPPATGTVGRQPTWQTVTAQTHQAIRPYHGRW